MSTPSLLGATLLVALAAPASDSPTFSPAVGSVLTKTFTERSDLELDSAVMTMNGEENERDQPEMELVRTHHVAVTDKYGDFTDGRARRVARSFDALTSELTFEINDTNRQAEGDFEGTSDLDGKEVVFSWDEDEEAYDVAYAAGEDGDASLLEGLTQDTDLVGFLPGKGVEVGDEWDVPAQALIALLRPGETPEPLFEASGGDMAEDEALVLLGALSLRSAADEAEGDIAARWEKTIDDDGRELARIALDLDVVLTRSVLDEIMDQAREVEAEGQVELFEEGLAEATWEASGHLDWDLAAGLPAALVLEGDVVVTLTVTGELDMGGQTADIELRLEASGTARVELVTETP